MYQVQHLIRNERSRTGQREKLNCVADATKTSAYTTGKFKAGVALHGYPELRQGSSDFMSPKGPVIGCQWLLGRGHNLRWVDLFGQGQFIERDAAKSRQLPIVPVVGVSALHS